MSNPNRKLATERAREEVGMVLERAAVIWARKHPKRPWDVAPPGARVKCEEQAERELADEGQIKVLDTLGAEVRYT